MAKRRTVPEIADKVHRGDAVVLTARELCARVREGEEIPFEEVDVVTSATCGVMSGTFATLSFTVAERDVFERAAQVSLNGVPAYVGPCPNERLGIVDLIVYGTARRDERYGGGHLFHELVARHELEVAVKTEDGRQLETSTSIDRIPFAWLCSTRNAYKNYFAVVNAQEGEVRSIFSVRPLRGPFKELTFSGCGELNPLEKDPVLATIGMGSKILLNGAEGMVIGTGTRSSPAKPNLMGIADMHGMQREYLGGFRTSAGPEIWTSWAVPIPIINEQVLASAKKLDEEIPVDVVDLHTRSPVGELTYADLWREVSVPFDRSACLDCETCQVAALCPTGAFDTQQKEVERERCFHCGTCLQVCAGNAFHGDMGAVSLGGMAVPVTLRQSDRTRAVKLAELLRQKILDGEFTLAELVSPLHAYHD